MAIDDFSRELYVDILPDKTQDSAAQFLANNVLAQCPCQVDYAYSDLRPCILNPVMVSYPGIGGERACLCP